MLHTHFEPILESIFVVPLSGKCPFRSVCPTVCPPLRISPKNLFALNPCVHLTFRAVSPPVDVALG